MRHRTSLKGTAGRKKNEDGEITKKVTLQRKGEREGEKKERKPDKRIQLA